MPMDSEKKAWPMAPSTTSAVSLLKSGLNRNVRPSAAPGIISEFTQKAINITNSNGISMLLTRSMPFTTPPIITNALMTRNTTAHSTERHPLTKDWNCA